MQVNTSYFSTPNHHNSGHGTCAPSRAALLTGRFPTRFGYEFTPISPWGGKVLSSLGNGIRPGIYHPENAVGRDYDTMTLPTDTVTLPKVLKKAGYRNLHLGKWHLGTIPESKPINQGFDETLDFSLISLFLPSDDPEAVNCRFDHDYLDKFLWANVRYGIRKNNGPAFKPNSYMTDYLAEEASKAIYANRNNPFFLYLALNAVHSPLQALRSDYDSLRNHIPDHCSRVYAAMIVSLDRAIGKILQTLTDLNLLDNTIVIFTSDNGAPNYISQPQLNQPFRGWKATLFEGGVRVPYLIQWPKKIPAGTQSNAVVSHTDIFATALAAATGGMNKDSERESELLNLSLALDLDGIDLIQHVIAQMGTRTKSESVQREEITHDRTLYWKSGHYSAIRKGDWKLQLSGNPQKEWLFNLATDPTEQTNLANLSEYSSVLKSLTAELRFQESQQAEPIWKSVSESPVAIDHTSDHALTPEDDFVYWPN
jgi:arylsulfatase A-like enzyme